MPRISTVCVTVLFVLGLAGSPVLGGVPKTLILEDFVDYFG